MKKKLNIVIILLLITVSLGAQESYLIRHFTIEKGLSQSSVNCIFQSSDGILWFGTMDGLNVFDGNNFQTFHSSLTDTNTIPDDFINDICEDDKGNIFIATRGGIAIWDRKDDKIKRLKKSSDKRDIQHYDILKVLYADNSLWALTPDALLKYCDGRFKEYRFVSDNNTQIIYNSLNTFHHLDLKADKNGNIWIATTNGLNVFYPQSERFYRIYDNTGSKLSNNLINCIFQLNDYIWIGTDKGLNKFNKTTGQITTYYYKNKEKNIRENIINSICIDSNNRLLIATDAGIKIFDGKQIKDLPANNPLSRIKEIVIQIKKDKSGNIWIGTSSNGIYEFIKVKSSFKTFPTPLYDSVKNIYSIYDDGNRLWIGSNNLQIINKNNFKIILNASSLKYKNYLKTFYTSFLPDKKYMWVGTNNGIILVDRQTLKLYNFNDIFKVKDTNLLRNNTVYSIVKIKKNEYWFGTDKGLIEFDGKMFHLYKNSPNDPNSINSSIVIKILADSNCLWLGTYSGFCKFSLKTHTAKHWNSKNGAYNIFVADIYKQNDSILWIAGDNGLSKFNIKTETFKNFNSENYGFTNDMFYQIQEDSTQNLYITSNYGIIRFNTKNYSYYNFEHKDGLPFYEFNAGASFKNKEGTMYFGGIKGLIWLTHPPQIPQRKPLKICIIKTERLSNLKKKETIYFPDTNKIYSFKEDEVIKIQFFTPDYTFPKKNKYVFRIKELSRNWSYLKNDNFITLAGLKHGKYTIEIKGANGFGIWNNSPTRLRINIIPPFSKSLLAKILYTFIIFILLLSVFIFFYFNIKKDNQILQEKNLALRQIDYQKKLLEQKNKDITDSINYAKRIIDAILPSEEGLSLFIPDSFIYFLPKDIVSGDFYWYAEKNDYFFIAAVDCTGHGIPGAFMSIIGLNLLNKFVNEGLDDPGVILNMMNKEVILTLKKQVDSKHLKDGMDMSLCIIDKRRQLLKFSGAYNPAYVIRDNNIIQLKGARISVGNDFDFDTFTTFSMKIRPDDYVYLFSDGFTDQFGGPELKKFKFRRFRFILLSIYQLPSKEQKEKLNETFMKWKGSNEQVDDVLVIGFKPFSLMNK